MPNPRRKARIIALQALYEGDSSGHKPESVMARLLAERPLPEELAVFAHNLVTGVIQHKSSIDDIIKKLAPTFPINQIATIDRNLLRLAIFEVLFDNRVPVKVAINEAVELAKMFGTSSSQKFINGVLGTVVTCYLTKKEESPSNNEHRSNE